MVKQFISYYFLSFVIVSTLMFLHYPTAYFSGTTIEYFQYLSYTGWLSQFIKFLLWSFVLTPFIIFVKNSKIVGNIFLFIFSFLVGLEKFIFYIQGSNTAWNIGFNESMLLNFISMGNKDGILGAYNEYKTDYHFWLYLVLFPFLMFLVVKFLLRFLPKIRNVKFLLTGSILAFVMLLTFFEEKESVPYFLRVPVVVENHIVTEMKKIVLNYKRKDIFLERPKSVEDTPKNILFIMDESVRGDLISINNSEEKIQRATPFLKSMQKDIINFGDLYSLANCSHQSNQLFMTGNLKHKDKNGNIVVNGNLDLLPTIFQYMKKAGYETYLLDSVQNGFFNGLQSYDKEFIDHYISFQKEPKLKRDFKSLEKIGDLLREPERKFIYVIKQGIHFPYEDNFKHDNPLFKDWNKSSSEGYLNLYLNAMKRAVDDYWQELVRLTVGTDTVVLWQSDHGVNIVPDEGRNNIGITHCETDLTHYRELYNVPGVLYSPNKKYYKGFRNLKNGYSVEPMFSTLLYFAGYRDFERIYGKIFKTPKKEVFIYLLNDLFDMDYLSVEDNLSELIDKDKKINKLNKRRL